MLNEKQEKEMSDYANKVYTIICLARNANGWESKSLQDSLGIIENWTLIFSHYKIPPIYLENLYFRAFEARRIAYQNGKPLPDMNAEMIVSGWTGANGLKAEIDSATIEADRRANPNSRYLNDGKIKCHYCFGCGFRAVSRFGQRGVIRCLHEEDYVLTSQDEIVGGDEGMEIIKVHLDGRGIAFAGNAKEFTSVIRGAFGKQKES